jgi:hypothetical protein
VVVKKNRVGSASGNGIDVTNSGDPKKDGKTPTNLAVRKNTVHGARLSGLHLALGSEDVKVSANVAFGNGTAPEGGFDCQDEPRPAPARRGAATPGRRMSAAPRRRRACARPPARSTSPSTPARATTASTT